MQYSCEKSEIQCAIKMARMKYYCKARYCPNTNDKIRQAEYSYFNPFNPSSPENPSLKFLKIEAGLRFYFIFSILSISIFAQKSKFHNWPSKTHHSQNNHRPLKEQSLKIKLQQST